MLLKNNRTKYQNLILVLPENEFLYRYQLGQACPWIKLCPFLELNTGVRVSIQSMGEMEKDFCPNFLQPLLKNIDRRSCNNRGRELIPVFHRVERDEGKPSSDKYPKGP